MSSGDLERIQDVLIQIPEKGLEATKQLIWTELDYPRVNQVLSTRGWPEGALAFIDESPVLLSKIGEDGIGFNIIYTKLSDKQSGVGFPLSIVAERSVINQLVEDHPLALFIFSDTQEEHWHFVNVKQEYEIEDEGEKKRSQQRVIRRISVGPHERLRTAAERLALVNLASIPKDRFGLSPLEIQKTHDLAFDVRKITEQFFQDYQDLFNQVQDYLYGQSEDKLWAHDYALQLLNRIMFLYFVQRKRWLNDDPDFIDSFWQTYQGSNRPPDTFFTEWLSSLFFEAFNNKFQAGRSDRSHIPADIRGALALAPYLNGGLYKKNELDTKYSFTVTDGTFQRILRLFNSYNFTISEDTPLDQEVAVDPEMIGKVYESLVNVTEETDERGEAGIFYTRRVEIDLMCRLSLVDWLANHLGEEYKSLLYELVFAFDPEEKKTADKNFTEADLWNDLNDVLASIKVVDPACGSGSFLIGMLYVLNDLSKRAGQQLGFSEESYDRKKRIIGDNLYGVDVMDWAAHVAELRLWLQLVIETEIPIEQLQVMPLLPELSFNIRTGDSLVQEIGGINLSILRKKSGIVSSSIKKKISELVREKKKYFNNDPSCQYHQKSQMQHEELNIFRSILDDQIIRNEKRLSEIDVALKPQEDLFGEEKSGQTEKDERKLLADQDRILRDLAQLKGARKALKGIQDIPFVWDISFVEVFEGERQGFDIVIGNPPYVRNENIKDPDENPDEATTESKKAYKEKLRNSVYQVWPTSFGYDYSVSSAGRNSIGLRSDLYLYFYFHGLALLDEKGSFCYITSNSWLDLDYGSPLQYFLLTRGCVKIVFDNSSYRSFGSADINTAIVVLGKPLDATSAQGPNLDNVIRFVNFYTPYENILDCVYWIEISEYVENATLPEYRLRIIKQGDSLHEGLDRNNQFIGDKWGGKYLRAPDIYHLIRKKSKAVLKPLSQLCEVEGYIHDNNTGETFPKAPFLKSIKDINRIYLSNTSSAIISYGVKPTGNSRINAPILFPRTFGTRHIVVYSPHEVYGKEFYKIIPKLGIDPIIVVAQLNSTFGILQREILGAVNLGDGAIKFSGREVNMFLLIEDILEEEVIESFRILSERDVLDFPDEFRRKDRLDLDQVIFAKLGLSDKEQELIYEEVIKLIENRLKKASSI